MCFIFHDWDKWGEIKKEHWTRQHLYGSVPVSEPYRYIKEYIARRCKKCGKYQKKYID